MGGPTIEFQDDDEKKKTKDRKQMRKEEYAGIFIFR